MAETHDEMKKAAAIEDGDEVLRQVGSIIELGGSLSPEEDRRILRKIDLCLLPVLFMSYLFQFLDKSAMGYTSILGLRTDLHLVGQDYAWASSIFYFGYLTFSFAASSLMIKLPVGKFLAGSVLIWAGILMCTAASQNTSGLQATRFFLGVAEAAVAPGFSILTSMFYKRDEQPLRHGAWFMGNVCSGLFGALIAYGMGHIHTIQPWRAVFLVFGGATVAWAVMLFFLLPDSPMTAWFFSKEDRVKAVERVRDNKTGIKNNHFKLYQVVDALTDPKAWLLVLIQLCCNIPNGGITSFGSIVIEGLGFSTLNTLLVQMIAVGFQATYVLLACGGSTLLKNTRTLWMAFVLVVSLVGTIMIRQIAHEHTWARFMGYCVLIAFSANFPMILTMVSPNIAGFTKKTTVNAMIFLAYCVGNIIGPQLFFADEAPGYTSGFLAMLVCFCVGIVLCFFLRFYLIWENNRRDKLTAAVNSAGDMDNQDISDPLRNLLDKTDREMVEFRYLY